VGQVVEPLGASTLPYAAPAPTDQFQPSTSGVDLDIDLPVGDDAPPSPAESTQTLSTSASMGDGVTFELPEPEEPKTVPVKPPASAAFDDGQTTISLPTQKAPPPAPNDGLDFDLASLPEPTFDVSPPPAPRPTTGETSILEPPEAAGEGGENPLARKLELAEEFRQIGDLEGARDLLEEVVAKADGALKAKAQGMLEKLG